jgi:hypothetical protein
MDQLLFPGPLQATMANVIIAVALRKLTTTSIVPIVRELYNFYLVRKASLLILKTAMAGLLSLGLQHKGMWMW